MDTRARYLGLLLAQVDAGDRPDIACAEETEDVLFDVDNGIISRAEADRLAHEMHLADPGLRDWAARYLAKVGRVAIGVYSADTEELNARFSEAGISAYAEVGRDWFYGHLNTPECPYAEMVYIRVGVDVSPEYVESVLTAWGYAVKRM